MAKDFPGGGSAPDNSWRAGKMLSAEDIDIARDVVIAGCGCDQSCREDSRCGCREDAKDILRIGFLAGFRAAQEGAAEIVRAERKQIRNNLVGAAAVGRIATAIRAMQPPTGEEGE